jgi:Isopenicillin N synthase and related dioxygenases
MINNLIPTIDISSLVKNDFTSKKSTKTIKEIEKACLSIGFFQVVGHGISSKKISNICKVVINF